MAMMTRTLYILLHDMNPRQATGKGALSEEEREQRRQQNEVGI